MALVSILIPCYNAERWLAQAIESALAQSWDEVEIIVVDDGSSDRSLEIAQGFAPDITVIAAKHAGGNAARNQLLRAANGDWLQYLDADDYLRPDKIRDQMLAIQADDRVDVLFSPVTEERWVGDKPATLLRMEIPEAHDPWVLLARWYLPQTGAPLWRRSALNAVGGWREAQSCCQEHELYFRLLRQRKRFRYCDSDGAVYRLWSDNTVSRRDQHAVNLERLHIYADMQAHLLSTNALTAERQGAINQARFEVARQLWTSDRVTALGTMATVRASQPRFTPRGAAGPLHYRIIYKLFGFAFAEALAALLRRGKQDAGAAAPR